MNPPPLTVADTAHINLLYIGQHPEIKKNPFISPDVGCGNSCFREFQTWLRKFMGECVKGNNTVEYGKKFITELFTMDVSNKILTEIGKLVRGNPYMNENSLRSQSNATYAILVTIMGRVRMMELE